MIGINISRQPNMANIKVRYKAIVHKGVTKTIKNGPAIDIVLNTKIEIGAVHIAAVSEAINVLLKLEKIVSNFSSIFSFMYFPATATPNVPASDNIKDASLIENGEKIVNKNAARHNEFRISAFLTTS